MRESKNDTKNERDRPDFWVDKMQETVDRNKVQMQQYVTFSRWATGDMSELVDKDMFTATQAEMKEALANQHAFVQETARANLFFRNPQVAIRCPWSKPMGVFTQGLAMVETKLTTDTMEQAGYFLRARRRLDDALNGPYGVLKITHEVDVAIDAETIDESRMEAQAENLAFVNNVEKMKATEDQLHSIHIEEHNKLLAMAQRGEMPMPKSAIKYIRAHIAKHDAMRKTEKPTETVRDASVVIRRKNPLDWFYDTVPDDMADAHWFAEAYFARELDVRANSDYDVKAREEIAVTRVKYARQNIPYPDGTPDAGTFRGKEGMVRIYEVIDLVDGVVREFAEGANHMLRVRPYGMKTIMPSGPYSILMFQQHPFESTGVPIPAKWAAEQRLMTALESMHAKAALRAVPRTGYNADILNGAELEQNLNTATCSAIPFHGVPREMKLDDLIAQVPAAEIKAESVSVGLAARARMQQLSGFGAQKLQSGDRADSATEAAIVASASDAISEDRAATLDKASENDVRMIVRLQRALYPKDRVVETVGPDAQMWWPETWSERDIVNDRAASIVTGSSRRRNTQIDTKLVMDFVQGIAPLPPFQGPAGQQLVIECARRIVEDNGISGLDWESVKAEASMMAQMTMSAGMGGEGSPADEGKPNDAAEDKGEGGSADESGDEPSQAAMNQGMQNVGGGRVATGASQGDRFRFLRKA